MKAFFDECDGGVETTAHFREKILDFITKLYHKHFFNENFYFKGDSKDFIKYFTVVEPILFDSNPDYRDHFIHQFWVFCLGSYIINRKCKKLREIYIKSLNIPSGDLCNNNALDYAWLLTSTLHDFAYPLDQVNKWLPVFINNFFPYEGKGQLFQIDLDKLLGEGKYLKKLNGLSTLFNALNNGEPWKSQRHYETVSNFHLTQILYKRLSQFRFANLPEEKDLKFLKSHSVLGAISLLTKFSDPDNVSASQMPYVDQIIYPSALAISLHHLHPKGPDKNLQKLGKLSFSKHLLAGLLIFSDSVQEWYRLGKNSDTEATLENFGFTGKHFTITMNWSPKVTSGDTLLDVTKSIKEHISFLKEIPLTFLKNDIKSILKLQMVFKTHWGDQLVDF